MSSTGTSGATSSGVLHIQNELSDFRSNMIQTASILEKHVGKAPFMAALLHKSIPKRPVTDTVFVGYEVDPEPVAIPIVECTSSGGGSTMDLSINQTFANQLEEGSILVNPHINVTPTGGAGYSRYSTNELHLVTKAELVVVQSITPGSPNATVVVRRMHTVYPNISDTNATTVLWESGDTVLRMNKQRYDSQPHGVPYNKLPNKYMNYIQDFTKDLGASERERNIELFVRNDIMKDRARSAFWSFIDEIERTMTYGSYGLDTVVSGRESTLTRSVEEIIPASNRLTMTALTMKQLNDVLEQSSMKGTATDKRILLCSPSALSHLTMLLQNHIISEGLYGDKEAGWTLKTYQDHTGSKYQLMASYQMGLHPGLKNTFYVLNMSNVRYAYFQGNERSFDVHLDKGYDGKGLQSKSSGDLIWRYRAMIGLDIGYWESHFKVRLDV